MPTIDEKLVEFYGKPISINSDYIKMAVCQYYRYKRQAKLVSIERGIDEWLRHNPDILIVNGERRLIEVEVKISLSDFKADIKKRVWKHRESGRLKMPFQFYYAVPKGLEEKTKPILREDCGLIVVEEVPKYFYPSDGVRVVKIAPKNTEAGRLTTKEIIKMVANQTGTLCSLMKKNYELSLLQKDEENK